MQISNQSWRQIQPDVMGAGGWGGKVMVTAATSLEDWKHVYTAAVVKLLTLTSHSRRDRPDATAAPLFSTETGPGRRIQGYASSLHCMLVNKNRHFMLTTDIETAVFCCFVVFFGGWGWGWTDTLFSVVSIS